MLRRLKHLVKEATAGWTVPIRGGPLQGHRWGIGTGLPFLLGRYEEEKARAMQAALDEGDVVFDVGAHVGYFAVIAARRVGPHGRVFAFEPRPLNLRFLHRHLEANDVRNVEVLEAAVGAGPGRGRFREDTGSATGHLVAGKANEARAAAAHPNGRDVRVLALDPLVAEGRLPPPDAIKIDVEGGELGVLRGAAAVLRDHRPLLFVATHGERLRQETTALLEAAGYACRTLGPVDHRKDVEMVAEPARGMDREE
jgi:FkbM family methyltransferase